MSSNQKGLYGKFLVIKVVDGTVIDDCFILRPQKDPAAVKALQTYAAHTENRALAEDLYKWVGRTMQKPLTYTELRLEQVVWLEDIDKPFCIPALVCCSIGHEIAFRGKHSIVQPSKDDYSLRWRAWASCPTDEERDAAPWQSDQKEGANREA